MEFDLKLYIQQRLLEWPWAQQPKAKRRKISRAMETDEIAENDSSDSNELGRIQDYVLKSLLSEGSRGSVSRVWKARHRESGQIVALKQIQLSKLTRSLKNCLDCEVNFLSSVNHPNIIRLLGVFEVCSNGFCSFSCNFDQFLSFIAFFWRAHFALHWNPLWNQLFFLC